MGAAQGRHVFIRGTQTFCQRRPGGAPQCRSRSAALKISANPPTCPTRNRSGVIACREHFIPSFTAPALFRHIQILRHTLGRSRSDVCLCPSVCLALIDPASFAHGAMNKLGLDHTCPRVVARNKNFCNANRTSLDARNRVGL